MATTLTDAQVEDFHRDGFTVVEGFVDGATCDRLRERAVELVDAWEPGVEHVILLFILGSSRACDNCKS